MITGRQFEMKNACRAVAIAAGLALAPVALATPSSTFWTPATTYTQPAGVPHLTYDTYFGEGGALQIDTGLTVGLLALPRLKVEVGFDLYYPTFTPRGQMGTLDFAQVNGRITVPFGKGELPAISLGICNVGFKKDVSNYDTVYGVLGWGTRIGTFGLGAYYGVGSAYLWTRMEGEFRGGLLASWVSRDLQIGAPGLDKIVFLVDVAAGKNWFGGAGAGVALYFTPAIAVRTGPVGLLDWDFYWNSGLPGWLWSIQLDVNMDLVKPKPDTPTSAPPAETSVPRTVGT